MTRLHLLVLIFLVPSLAFPVWVNKKGEKLADVENQKSIGNFGAQLILVADENELFKRWATPSVSVDVKTIDSVKVNGFINAFVVFGGCKPDAKGNCNVSMQFRVTQPDGKVYTETPSMEVWENKPSPQGKALELSVQYLKLLIEPKDQLGQYVVYTEVRDKNSDAVLKLQSPFMASKNDQ